MWHFIQSIRSSWLIGIEKSSLWRRASQLVFEVVKEVDNAKAAILHEIG